MTDPPSIELRFDQLCELIKDSVVKVGAQFTRPDDDWMPIAFVDSPQGLEVLMMDGHADKYAAIAQLSSYVRKVKARKIGTVWSAWLVEAPIGSQSVADLLAGTTQPAEHPNRVEAVMVTVFDTEISRSFVARIQRDEEDPPTLDEWEELSRDAEVGGAMYDPIRAVLR